MICYLKCACRQSKPYSRPPTTKNLQISSTGVMKSSAHVVEGRREQINFQTSSLLDTDARSHQTMPVHVKPVSGQYKDAISRYTSRRTIHTGRATDTVVVGGNSTKVPSKWELFLETEASSENDDC